jgi:hypothetical protein
MSAMGPDRASVYRGESTSTLPSSRRTSQAEAPKESSEQYPQS